MLETARVLIPFVESSTSQAASHSRTGVIVEQIGLSCGYNRSERIYL